MRKPRRIRTHRSPGGGAGGTQPLRRRLPTDARSRARLPFFVGPFGSDVGQRFEQFAQWIARWRRRGSDRRGCRDRGCSVRLRLGLQPKRWRTQIRRKPRRRTRRLRSASAEFTEVSRACGTDYGLAYRHQAKPFFHFLSAANVVTASVSAPFSRRAAASRIAGTSHRMKDSSRVRDRSSKARSVCRARAAPQHHGRAAEARHCRARREGETDVCHRVLMRTVDARGGWQRRESIERIQHLCGRAFEQAPTTAGKQRIATENGGRIERIGEYAMWPAVWPGTSSTVKGVPSTSRRSPPPRCASTPSMSSLRGRRP